MKLDNISHIIMADCFDESVGQYDVRFHNMKVEYKGIDYLYHSSGLCRHVYISPCRTFVLKIPREHSERIGVYTPQIIAEQSWKYLEWPIKHNLLEFLAYEQCPEDLKIWFAKTELLENCWLKQEFVEVFPVSGISVEIRELGRRIDGQICLFDFDPLIEKEMFGKCNKSLEMEDVSFERWEYEDKVINRISRYEPVPQLRI